MLYETRKWASGEKQEFAIEYILDGKHHLYYPDFVVENEIIECKPKYAQQGPLFESKVKAANEWCKKRGFVYKVLDLPAISKEDLLKMHEKGEITLCEKTLRTINKNNCG